MTDQTTVQPRFQLIENNPEFPNDGQTRWYWDTGRPTAEMSPGFIMRHPLRHPLRKYHYVAVECSAGKDPNQFVRCHTMRLLFTDQAEFYVVCQRCYGIYNAMQWSGSTRGHSNWREISETVRVAHEAKKGWCEFCDPIFGNGGWVLDR